MTEILDAPAVPTESTVPTVGSTDHLTADVVNGLDFKVADLALAEFCLKELTPAEYKLFRLTSLCR